MTWSARFGLAGRTALVTGARAGIGRAAAVALADAGADLVLWGHHDDLDETAREVSARGRQVTQVVGDLGDPEAAAELAAEIARQHHVDILVNNAGVIHRAPALSVSQEDWRAVLRVNLDAVFALTQAVGAGMVERGAGKVVTIASLLSFQGGVSVPAYAASKHAVLGLTRALANEWASAGVNVNAVAPGYVVTDNTAPLRADAEREAAIRDRIPAGRWATPADIADTVVFLAAPASDYIHGEVIAVDGGWLGR